jgi:hypothetical protein
MNKKYLVLQFSESLFVVLLGISLPLIFCLGFYYGTAHVDKETVEVRNRVKEMRDSIDMYRQREAVWRSNLNSNVGLAEISCRK